MVEYLKIAVLLAILLGSSVEAHHRENAAASVFYMIQPPPDLPCNPYINEWSREYGRTVLQCYVIVSEAFTAKTRAKVSLFWYSNVTISKDGTIDLQRTELDTIKVLLNGYIIYKATQLVEGYQFSQDKYWCQVFLNGGTVYDSVQLPPSSVTTIKNPKCYQHLPSCTHDIPLGLPVALTVFSDHDSAISESCMNTNLKNSASETAIQELVHQERDGSDSLLCNGTAQNGRRVSNAMVITPNVFLSFFIVLLIAILAVVLVKYVKQRKTKPKMRGKDSSNKAVMRTHKVIDGQLKQIRRVSSLPDIHIHTNKNKPARGDALSDSGIVGDSTFNSRASNDPIQAGKLLGRIRNCYKVLPMLGPKSKSEDHIFAKYAAEGSSSLDRLSQSRDSYVYVTPNPVTFPIRKSGRGTVSTDELPSSTTQPGVYLTLVGSASQAPLSAISDELQYTTPPIYEDVGDFSNIV